MKKFMQTTTKTVSTAAATAAQATKTAAINAKNSVVSFSSSAWASVCGFCHSVRVKAGVAMSQIMPAVRKTCSWVKARVLAAVALVKLAVVAVVAVVLVATAAVSPTYVTNFVGRAALRCADFATFAWSQVKYTAKLSLIFITACAIAWGLQVAALPRDIGSALHALLRVGSVDCSPEVRSEIKFSGDKLISVTEDAAAASIKFGAASAVGYGLLSAASYVFGAFAATTAVVGCGVVLLVSASAAFAIVAATASLGVAGLALTAKVHGNATESFIHQAQRDPRVCGVMAVATAC